MRCPYLKALLCPGVRNTTEKWHEILELARNQIASLGCRTPLTVGSCDRSLRCFSRMLARKTTCATSVLASIDDLPARQVAAVTSQRRTAERAPPIRKRQLLILRGADFGKNFLN
jgi:hypothetical protein